jgi:hypothetical protein
LLRRDDHLRMSCQYHWQLAVSLRTFLFVVVPRGQDTPLSSSYAFGGFHRMGVRDMACDNNFG